MTAFNRRTRRWLLVTIMLVSILELAYVLSANVLLRSDILLQLLNRDPDRFSAGWSNGRSLVPGWISVENLTLNGTTERQRWSLSTATAEIQVSLWRLPFKTLHVGLVRADGGALSLHTLTGKSTIEAAPALPEPSTLPPVPGDQAVANIDAKAALTSLDWNIEIDKVHLSGIRELELDEYRLTGNGSLEGERISLLSSGTLSAAQARLQLDSGTLGASIDSIAQDLQIDADLRLHPLETHPSPTQEALGSVSGTVHFSGQMSSYGFFDRYLTGARWLKLGGHGDLSAALRIELGKLVEGSELTIASPRLMVELDEPDARDQGARYLVEGAGSVTSVIASTDGQLETRLLVELRDMEARRGPDAPMFLTGKAFRLSAVGPAIDLSTTPAEPSILVELDNTVMPDISVLNQYIPGTPPFSLASGSARLNGRFEYADKVLTGSLDLAGERISGRILDEAVVGQLGVALVVKQANLQSTLLDLSGSRVRMQAAQDDGEEHSPLSTEIRVLEARFESPSLSRAIGPIARPPPINGVLRLEGTVANTDFLSNFLPHDSGLELGGDGRMSAQLRVEAGRLAPDSILEVTSERLVSRFLGLEATGSGLVQGEVRSADAGPEILLRVSLRDMSVLRLADGKPVFNGDLLDLTARGRMTDPGAAPDEPGLTIAWKNAIVPDVAVLNAYLTGQQAFGLKSGTARASGHLDYIEQVLSGNLDLAGDRVEGTVFDEPVTGQLDLALVIKHADPSTLQLDISGTRIRMQAAASGKGKKRQTPLTTEIRLMEARIESELPLDEFGQRPGPPPIRGVIKVDGKVANIDLINRFLGGKQRLGFGGDGRLEADLRLSGSRLAPGSNLEIRSERLVSRFLDFEAKGKGLLKALVRGRPTAPGGEIAVVLSDFAFRRMDETTPYIQGKRLELKTAGERLDRQNVLRDLDTNIELWAAEIPDMTVYNRYLPLDSGLAIITGKGRIEGGFHLSGISGSGSLELRAKGIEVKVENQTLKGDLRIATQLRKGNLEDMTFDVSGTRVRIDKGSLLNAGQSKKHDWWGQIDLDAGRMTWRQPLALDAIISLKLRDSGLLVNLFVEQEKDQQWLNDLLTIRNVTGKGRVVLDDETLTLGDARIAGDGFLVLANARLRKEQVEGALYAKYGVLSAGIELVGDKTQWRLLNAREWFDSHARAFSTSVPQKP